MISVCVIRIPCFVRISYVFSIAYSVYVGAVYVYVKEPYIQYTIIHSTSVRSRTQSTSLILGDLRRLREAPKGIKDAKSVFETLRRICKGFAKASRSVFCLYSTGLSTRRGVHCSAQGAGRACSPRPLSLQTSYFSTVLPYVL